MDADDSDVDAGNGEHEDDFRAWLGAGEPGGPEYDSDCDPDEALDGLGELPVSFETSVAVLFLVDRGRHMSRCDVSGSDKSRIDAVFDLIKHLIEQQRAAGATLDRYTLVAFGMEDFSYCYEVVFRGLCHSDAIAKLESTAVIARQSSKYCTAIQAIGDVAVKGQRMRVIMMADGNSDNDPVETFQWLQRIVAVHPQLDVHTVAIGEGDFSVLQQIAQIGRGTFSCAAADFEKLVNTFTCVSATLTQTRSVGDQTGEHGVRQVSFECAKSGCAADTVAFKKKVRRATRHVYALSRSRRDGLSGKYSVGAHYQIRKNPFMQGGMRILYRFSDLEMPRLRMVAKFSKYEKNDKSWEYVRSFVLNTLMARFYGNRFHRAVWAALGTWWEPRRLVSVAQCFTYQAGETWWVAERFLEGSERGFFKWTNNKGQILIPRASCQYVMAAESFAHFTLEDSNGKHMVSDIQGVPRGNVDKFCSLSLTDPQIISRDSSFGVADLGTESMQRFRSLHVCSPLCRRLGLTPLSTFPTVPRTVDAVAGRRNKDPVRRSHPEVIPPESPPRRGRSPPATPPTSVDGKAPEETVSADSLLFLAGNEVRKLLFVGEYTHGFSAAAARLVSTKLQAAGRQVGLDWWSTALNRPTVARLQGELRRCKDFLEHCGARVLEGIDAKDVQMNVEGLHGAIWVMAFPRDSQALSSSSYVRVHMQEQVSGFVRSVATKLHAGLGKVTIIFMAMQHLAWKLPEQITTGSGLFMREVYWLEFQPFLREGYKPRFGDFRDENRDATYHTNDEVVVAQWRKKCGPHDIPAGMTDQRVRSVSAERRSRSTSRSCSR